MQHGKNLPARWETYILSLGWECSLEEGRATTPVFLLGESPWRQQPGRLQSMGSRRVGHDWANKHSTSSWEKKRCKRQRRKINIHLLECRFPKKQDKKALSEQRKERKKNNRMWKIRELCKKIRDTKGTFHATTSMTKDSNDRYLIKVDEIKKWQEYTEELHTKSLNDPDNHECDHSPKARHPGEWSQVGLRKNYYEQS